MDEFETELTNVIAQLEHLAEYDEVTQWTDRKALVSRAIDAMETILRECMPGMPSPKLKNMIKEKSFRKGQFTLASGVESEYFFDLKPTMLDPLGSNLIAEAVLSKLNFLYDVGIINRVDAVGGMAVGGVPIVSVISAVSHLKGHPMPVFFVRKATKDHGTERLIEGTLEVGWTVVLVEDVTTTGDSIMQAVRAVREAGCEVHDIITLVDRLEGAVENLNEEGIELHAIFTRADFED